MNRFSLLLIVFVMLSTNCDISRINDPNLGAPHEETDYWILKLDESGNIQWEKSLGGSNDEYAYSIQQTTDGGFVVAGNTLSNCLQ